MKVFGIFIIALLLFTAGPIYSKVRKDEPVVDKIADDLYVSKGDIQEISTKINLWFLSIMGFVALEVYRAYQKRGDKTSQNLEILIKVVERMETEIRHLPTRDEARQISREEVTHYHSIR